MKRYLGKHNFACPAYDPDPFEHVTAFGQRILSLFFQRDTYDSDAYVYLRPWLANLRYDAEMLRRKWFKSKYPVLSARKTRKSRAKAGRYIIASLQVTPPWLKKFKSLPWANTYAELLTAENKTVITCFEPVGGCYYMLVRVAPRLPVLFWVKDYVYERAVKGIYDADSAYYFGADSITSTVNAFKAYNEKFGEEIALDPAIFLKLLQYNVTCLRAEMNKEDIK